MKKIAVLGYGVVGSGVVELFYRNQKKIEKNTGTELEIGYILDLREFPDDPYGDRVVHDIQVILDDPEVGYVAECMGGVNPAFDFVRRCLEAGKSVATSNKQLVAEKGDILLQVAKAHHVNFFFEASVGGAIPIIRPLHTCLAANDISAVAGILNGTTNFILEKMFCDKMRFDDALALAQKLGYAERDPSADIDGGDACRKICILSSLVFGKHVYPEQVYTKGIRNITLEDVQLAQDFGGAVKLIGAVKRLESGKILPTVMPMVVMNESLISHVNGVFNAVMVWGDGVDKTMFYGRGAGWQRQLHIYECPFYYIDYCLSTMAALQFFLLSLKDHKDAWQRYLKLVRRAGTASYSELCETAGLKVPFTDGSIKTIAEEMEAWIAAHQA